MAAAPPTSTIARAAPASQWLDTQSGRLMRSTVERLGSEPVETAKGRLTATRYRLAGDLSCELWYADQRWCKLRFGASDGSAVDYVLESSPSDPSRLDRPHLSS